MYAQFSEQNVSAFSDGKVLFARLCSSPSLLAVSQNGQRFSRRVETTLPLFHGMGRVCVMGQQLWDRGRVPGIDCGCWVFSDPESQHFLISSVFLI